MLLLIQPEEELFHQSLNPLPVLASADEKDVPPGLLFLVNRVVQRVCIWRRVAVGPVERTIPFIVEKVLCHLTERLLVQRRLPLMKTGAREALTSVVLLSKDPDIVIKCTASV